MKVLQYSSAFEAEVVRGRLESEGIRAIVHNSNLPYLNQYSSISPYVEVSDEDFERAVEILGRIEGDPTE